MQIAHTIFSCLYSIGDRVIFIDKATDTSRNVIGIVIWLGPMRIVNNMGLFSEHLDR